MTPSHPIRPSAKAIIITDGRLLCTRNRDQQGIFHLLPGGGQNPGETLAEAVRRECHEEIGATIEVGDLRLVREYISAHHEFAASEPDVQQTEYMFVCRLTAPLPLTPPSHPDQWQEGFDWLPIEHLAKFRLYPKVLIHHLGPTGVLPGVPVYLGDVN